MFKRLINLVQEKQNNKVFPSRAGNLCELIAHLKFCNAFLRTLFLKGSAAQTALDDLLETLAKLITLNHIE